MGEVPPSLLPGLNSSRMASRCLWCLASAVTSVVANAVESLVPVPPWLWLSLTGSTTLMCTAGFVSYYYRAERGRRAEARAGYTNYTADAAKNPALLLLDSSTDARRL